MNTEALYRKTAWRLVPFLFLCYIAAFIDRINVGHAHLQMKETLGFSDAVYGLGASIFFVTYVIFEIPSNLLMAKFGIRKTLFRIMLLWGLASIATALVTSPWQFYAARLLLVRSRPASSRPSCCISATGFHRLVSVESRRSS